MSELPDDFIQRSSEYSRTACDTLAEARVSIWDKDFSDVLDLLEDIRGEGIQDLCAYFHDRPDRLSEALARVRINDVNAYSVELFEAQSKTDLLRSLVPIFVPETYNVFAEELVALWDGSRYFKGESFVQTLKGNRRKVAFTVAFAGELCEHTVVNMLDLPIRQADASLLANFSSLFEDAEDAIVCVALDGVIASWNRGAKHLYGYSASEVVGKSSLLLIPAGRDDEEEAILNKIRSGNRVEHYETVRKCKDGRLIDVSLTVSPIKSADGAIIGASKIARDVTVRLTAQEHQRILVSELQHRVKNTFSIVSAIANQTLQQVAPDDLAAFHGRLQALSAANDLLTSDSWARASFRDVVDRALSPFQIAFQERVRVGGPEITIPAAQSMILTLAFHELATNAVKYGALSNGRGEVHVGWDVNLNGPDRYLSIHWQEKGGPIVKTPKRQGFGSKLIERVVGAQARSARLEFAPDGLFCAFELPLEGG